MIRLWNAGVAERVCLESLVRFGIANARPRLISFRQNAIFHLAGHEISIRVYGPAEAPGRARLMVACARWLEAVDFPAVRLYPAAAEQPVEVLGHEVSIWHWIKQDDPQPDVAFRFGCLLRHFHQLPCNNQLAVPAFDPLRKIRQRLDRVRAAGIIPVDGYTALDNAFNRATEMAPERLNPKLGQGTIHGDAMPGNVIQSADRLVMIDLDSVSSGSHEWDLVPTFVARRFGQGGEARWRQFLAGYGADENDLTALNAASVIKQLSMTVYLCLSAGQTNSIDEEIDRRLRLWSEWNFDSPWTSGFTVAPAA